MVTVFSNLNNSYGYCFFKPEHVGTRPTDIHGYPWISMDIHEYPWISMDIHRSGSDMFRFEKTVTITVYQV